ncbi:DNA polymerase IV [Acidiphilium sp.]|uniref:DNA polymerase IV n=1 Tax=Acidiphilium sp. TaxID=527 RepID=UPI003D014764
MDRTSPTPAPTASLRRIVHIDMDAFYASVEQRDDPSLRFRPVAVGGNRARGVVAAASYEARQFGVRSAMPSVTAQRQCPDLIFVPPRFEVYKAVSLQVHDIFRRYTAIIQPLSLDEAYLDVTAPLIDRGSATAIAAEIRAAIKAETGLTASAGVSYNKFLAKLASDYRKPDGLFVITPKQGPGFVETLPVGKFHGVGPVTASRMNALGIYTGLDLRRQSLAFLTGHFGKAAAYYYGIARGEDDRPVDADRVRKSLGTETTFPQDLAAWHEVEPALVAVCARLWAAYQRGVSSGRTVTVKLKFTDFRQITRSRSTAEPIVMRSELERISLDLARSCFPLPRPLRLLGVTLSNLDDEDRASRQLALPFDHAPEAPNAHSARDSG